MDLPRYQGRDPMLKRYLDELCERLENDAERREAAQKTGYSITGMGTNTRRELDYVTGTADQVREFLCTIARDLQRKKAVR